MAGSAVDVVVIGAGHNGLVAAFFLARGGLRVRVVEDQGTVGGAVRTERPFAKAPDLATSSGASLLGLMPADLVKKLGVELPLRRRDPHLFLPARDKGYLMLGSDAAATKHHFLEFFSEADWRANEAMHAELAQIRDDIAPTWLEEPLSIEQTADKHVRPALREAFVALCRGSVGDYLSRFDFKSEQVRALFATLGTRGVHGAWSAPGTGMNFLVQSMGRLPGADWMAVEGGMGVVSQRLADVARRAGAAIEVNRRVTGVVIEGNVAKGVAFDDGTVLEAGTVVCNADPFRMRDLVGADQFPAEYNQRLDTYASKPGSLFKLDVALDGLPKFVCCPEDKRVYGPTIHLLPETSPMQALLDAFAEVSAGRLPERPAIDLYIHTAVDPTLRDASGRHSASLVVQAPYELAGGKSWDAEAEGYARRLLSIVDRFAPGTSDLVVDLAPMHPKKIERHFGMTRGHTQHVDNGWGFSDRLPYATPVAGLYSCSAGCHPAGSVIGASGHNAAMRVIKDLEAGLEETQVQPL